MDEVAAKLPWGQLGQSWAELKHAVDRLRSAEAQPADPLTRITFS